MEKDNEPKSVIQRAQDLVPPSSASTNEKQCPWCNEPNFQDAKYCRECGNLLAGKQCQRCKKLNAQNAKYCIECGKLLTQTLYERYGPRAEKIKISLQMIVGVILTGLIIVYVAIYIYVLATTHKSQLPLPDVTPLTIVGFALAISTAFELAYTLFTDGPDEAVNPVITSIAVGILLLISPNLDFRNAGAVALLALALVVLFILKEFFIENRELIHRFVGRRSSEPTSKGDETKDASSITLPPINP